MANPSMPDTEEFIDESGRTSMEPEGPGKHPHTHEVYPDPGSKQRWENDLGAQPGEEEDDFTRGPIPAEGDGDGAPL